MATDDFSATESPMHMLARTAWQVVLITGIVALVLGILVLVWPGLTLVVLGILFGAYLIVTGALQLGAAFGTGLTGGRRALAFVVGVLCVLLGILCFFSATRSILLLALWIGVGWLLRGISYTAAAGTEPSSPARGWQILFGVLSIVAGIVIIAAPFTSLLVLTLLGGCWLVVLGVMEIVTALRAHHERTRGMAAAAPQRPRHA